MKVLIISSLVVGCLVGQVQAQTTTTLKEQKQKVGYSFGVNLGRFLKSGDVEIDLDMLVQGVKDAMAGNKTLVSQEEENEVLRSVQTQVRTKQTEKRRLLGEKFKAEAPAFFATNAKKAGVKTLPDGLQYKVVSEGNGTPPKSNDVVTVNYRGRLLDGTEFDSSYKRGQPATFAVNGVIKGWTEALQMMKPGAKWELYIPMELGYREMGFGANIPPYAPLIFEVELLGIKPTAQPHPPEPVTSDIIKVPSKAELDKGAKIEVIKKEDLEKKK